jgi:hypothetical protein
VISEADFREDPAGRDGPPAVHPAGGLADHLEHVLATLELVAQLAAWLARKLRP